MALILDGARSACDSTMKITPRFARFRGSKVVVSIEMGTKNAAYMGAIFALMRRLMKRDETQRNRLAELAM
jgi:hypothetical protein